MPNLVDIAAGKAADRFGEALNEAYVEFQNSEPDKDIDAFVSFIVWDWLMSHGYLQHDESTPTSTED